MGTCRGVGENFEVAMGVWTETERETGILMREVLHIFTAFNDTVEFLFLAVPHQAEAGLLQPSVSWVTTR